MKITMVKKRLADGSDCRKCKQVSELLDKRGFTEKLDRTVWAEANDKDSEGMRLARLYDVETAPFFIVEFDDAPDQQKLYTSALKMMKDCFAYEASLIEKLEEKARMSGGEV